MIPAAHRVMIQHARLRQPGDLGGDARTRDHHLGLSGEIDDLARMTQELPSDSDQGARMDRSHEPFVQEPPMAKLGFLGLGAMGTPMVARLIQAGHQVRVWNRTRSRAEAFAGRAQIIDTPAEAARGVETVITMLATPDALSEVLFGDQGVTTGIEPGTTLIDMSTVGPDYVLEVAARLPDGVEFIDAPVLGSVANAEDGSLQIFVGATEASFARCKELLAPMGTPIHLGPTGAGAAMKLVANSTLAGLMSLIGEALALADGFGLEQDRVIPALLDSPIGPALSRKLDKIEGDHYTPSFKLSLMRKDLSLVLDAAQRRGSSSN
jgi:3-hydroxyisobutyrate dehydrogenase/2-hydroxy-3-oxopropionate reductase